MEGFRRKWTWGEGVKNFHYIENVLNGYSLNSRCLHFVVLPLFTSVNAVCLLQQAINGHEGMALTTDGIQLMGSDGQETVHLPQNVLEELIHQQGLQTSKIE